MEGRVCKTCETRKTADSFYLNKRKKLRSECKECANKKSLANCRERKDAKDVDFYISRMASALITRTKSFEYYVRNNIKNNLGSHEDIVAFVKSNFYDDVKRILENGESPSIDRIDPDGDYDETNIRIITLYENQIRGFETCWKNNSRGLTCIYPDGKREAFESIKEAHKSTGLDRKTIRDSLNLKRRTRFGYMFLENEREAK